MRLFPGSPSPAGYGLPPIQERTPDDVQVEGSHENIRGHLVERFPRPLGVEIGSHPGLKDVVAELPEGRFSRVPARSGWVVLLAIRHL
jgi:hypothetical protein